MDRFDKTLIGLFVLLILGSVFWFNSFIVPFSYGQPATSKDILSQTAALQLSQGQLSSGENITVKQAEKSADLNRVAVQQSDTAAEALAAAEKKSERNIFAGAFKAGMSLFSKKLAEDTAVWVASGGKGQQPLFVTEGWDAYLRNVGDAALGEMIDNFMTDQLNWGEGAFKDLCEPNFNIKLGIILGINQQEIDKPRCRFSDIVNNWDKAIDNANFSLEYRAAIQKENDINLYLRTQGRQFEVVDEAVNTANSELNATEGWLSAKNKIGWVLTPGSVVRKKYEDSTSPEVTQWKDVATGTAWDFIETFLNTLASQLLKNLQTQGLFGSGGGSRSGYDYLSSLYGYSTSPNRSDSKSATKRFNNSVEVVFQGGSQYDILAKLLLCTDKKKNNPGPTDCVIDTVFSSAISNKTLVNDLPPSVLDRPFAPKVEQVVNPQTAFTLRNVTILRKYRIVPVGWEIAARYISEHSDKGYTLGELVDLYKNGCDGQVGDNKFLCDLIDPYWVLKAPELFCRREGYGPNLSSSGDDTISRIDYCADEQQCLQEDDNGNCQNFGYCTEEKRVWDLGIDTCEPRYNTCQAFTSPDGVQEAYLTDTLDYASCSRDNAGCKWYSQNKEYNSNTDTGNQWEWTTSTPKMFFDRDVEACDSNEEGCSQFIRTGAGLGSNLVINGSFETNESWPSDDIVHNNDVTNTDINSDNYLLHRGDAAYLLSGTRVGDQSINLQAGTKYALSASLFTKGMPDSGELSDYSYLGLERVGEGSLSLVDVDNSNLVPVADGTWQRVYKIFTSKIDQTVKIKFNYSSNGVYYFDDIQLEKLNRGTNSISDYTDYNPSARPDSQLAYLKKAPDYYGCYDTNPDEAGVQWPQTLSQLNDLLNTDPSNGKKVMSDQCNNYAGACIESEVGCQLYTPINGDPAIPATITSNDLCPAECVGYQSYRQEKTNFISSRYTQFIADNTPKYCSANYAGCDEFTNLDTVGGGGESLEYYVDLRECQKPGEGAEGTFVTWRGDDTKGYALKDYKLRKSNGVNLGAPSTNIRYDESGNIFSVDNQIRVGSLPNGTTEYLGKLDESVGNAIDSVAGIADSGVSSGNVGEYLEYLSKNNNITNSEILNPAVLESLHSVGICIPQEIRGYSYYNNDGATETSIYVPINPDCTEFYSSDGIISYRLLSRVIYVDDLCKPYRRTQTQVDNALAESDCTNSSGYWNDNDECIYRAIPNQGVTCPATYKGCREYVGNQGGNVRNVSYDTFEGSVGSWTGGELTQEAASAGGMSVKATDLKKNVVLDGNKAYILSFWAKGVDSGETNFDKITLFNSDKDETKYFASADNTDDSPNISVGDLWHRYELGPVFVDWDMASVQLEFSAKRSGVYLDNILLKEVKDSVYLVENSWWTPFSCDNKLDDPDGVLSVAGAVEGVSCSSTGARTRCSIGEMLGCSSYKDLNKDTFNLRSFESLCRRDAVGCEELIDTHNSDSSDTISYNDGDSNGSNVDDVTVPADQLVYLVNDSNYSCDAKNKGCTAYGLPTIEITPTGEDTENEDIVGWSDVYYKNLPDKYTNEPNATLCQLDELWCDEYAVDDSYIDFKNPRNKKCEYKIGDNGSYGWYKGEEGHKIACQVTDMMTIGLGTRENKEQPVGPKDFMTGSNNADYHGWVGVCPVEQSGCTEYIDPATTIYTNMILHSSSTQEVNVSPHTLYSISVDPSSAGSVKFSCTPPVSVISPDNTMSIDANGTATMVGYSGRFYIVGNSINGICSVTVTGSVNNLALVRSGVYYASGHLDKTSCAGVVDNDIGCVLLNDRSNLNLSGTNLAESNNYLTYNSTLTGRGRGAPQGGDTVEMKNDSDIIAKVYPNRECYSWLHCTTYEKDDPSSFNETAFGDSDRCLNIGLCTSLDSDGQCNNLVVSNNSLAPMKYNSTRDANKTGYSYYGKDSADDSPDLNNNNDNNNNNKYIITGYAPYHMMKQVGEVANVTNGNFESVFEDSGEPLGWVAYNTISAVRLPVPEGLDIIKDASESREGVNYLRLNTSFEAESETVDVFSGTEYMVSGWINTLDLYPYHSKIKTGILIKEFKHDGTALDPSQTNCASDDSCNFWIYDNDWQVWDSLTVHAGLPWTKYYQKIKTGLGVGRIKIKLVNWSEVLAETNGVSCDTSVGVIKPGTTKTVCDVGGMSYFDNIEMKPFLQVNDKPEFAERLCRLYPKYNSPACDYMTQDKSYHGWSGYCLVKDPENPRICLQWWPIDRIKGDSIDDTDGYQGKVPVYYAIGGEAKTIYEYRHAFWLQAGSRLDDCDALKSQHACGSGYKIVRTYHHKRGGKDAAECACVPNDIDNEVKLDGNSNNFEDASGDEGGWYHLDKYIRSEKDGWYKSSGNLSNGNHLYQIRPSSDSDAGDVKYQDLCPENLRNNNGYCYYSKKLSRNNLFATDFVRVVTPAGTNKSWFSRVFDGSSFRIDLGSQNFAYHSSDPPFGSATPPAPINTPTLWDGDPDTSGRQQLAYNPKEGAVSLGTLYSCPGCSLDKLWGIINYGAEVADQPYKYFNLADLAGTAIKGRELIQKIFAQSYNFYSWVDLDGNYCDLSAGTCTGDSTMSCTSQDICSQNKMAPEKQCDSGYNQGASCDTDDNCSYDITNSCVGWSSEDDGTGSPTITAGICDAESDGGGKEAYTDAHGTEHDAVPADSCTGATQAEADAVCWSETLSSQCITGKCNQGVNVDLPCGNNDDCQSLNGTCKTIVNWTNYDNYGECEGTCRNSSGEDSHEPCTSNSDCFTNPAYVEVDKPGWSPPNIMCRYDNNYNDINSDGINKRRSGTTTGLDYCGVAPIVKDVKVDGHTGDVEIKGGGKVIRLDFNVDVNANQLPLASYRIDWGDGTAISVSGVNLKARPDAENTFTLYHYYNYWQLKADGKTSCGADYCTVRPKVHVRDSWGWCNASGDNSSVSNLARKGYYSGNNSYAITSDGSYNDLEHWAIGADALYLIEENTTTPATAWADYYAIGVLNQYNVGRWNREDKNYAWCKPDRNTDTAIKFTFETTGSLGLSKLEIYFAGPYSGWEYPTVGNGENYGISKVEVWDPTINSNPVTDRWVTVYDSDSDPAIGLDKLQKNSFVYTVDLSEFDHSISVGNNVTVRVKIPGDRPNGALNGVWGCIDAVKLTEKGGANDPFDCDVGEDIKSDAWTYFGGDIKIMKE